MTPESFGTVVLVCFICLVVAGTVFVCLMALRGMWKVIRTWNRSRPTDLW